MRRGRPRPQQYEATFLPNHTAFFFSAHHRITGLTLKRFGKLRHVRKRTVDAKARKRMRIGLRLKPCGLGRVFFRPNLRPTKEESLLRREAINICRARLTLQRLHKGVVGNIEPAEIRDGFAGDEFALKVQAWLCLKT